ncbi:hypothetical protein CHF27_001335 [Romboutsia maritimum]|uniref:Uncharacterized protein n=1 Tax=Romboutsia maritimum TaxID=2020948 RepID=A0A371IWL3_9FIRM|nr:hypothetical protein [Romboutsia maritimum]RDY24870.1 hypothetical protein CHF27_001335 [Romboutsia maritimum]
MGIILYKIKEILKFITKWIIIFFSTIILFFGVYIIILKLQEFIFVPKDYFMWTINSPQNKVIFILEFIWIIFIMYKASMYKEKKKSSDFYKKNQKIWKKHRKSFILVNIVLLYAVITNVSVIDYSKIKTYSIFHPLGKEYSIEDIKSINTGVYGSRIPYIRDKGQFYYKIKFNDDSTIDINNYLGGTKEEMETYLEIEKLDKYFISKGLSKTSSMKNIEYVDRFKRILQ